MISIAPKSRRLDTVSRDLPRGSSAMPWRDLILPGLAVAITLWLGFWSFDYPFDRATRLSARLELRERVVAERSPFTLWLPVPSRWDRVETQTILRDGGPVFSSRVYDPKKGTETSTYPRELVPYPSPDERFVALEDLFVRTNNGHWPISIVDVESGRATEVLVPDSVAARERRRAPYPGYPLRFHGWTPDSRLALVRFDGTGVSAHDLAVYYRELWGADPGSGHSAIVRRCEVPSYGAPYGEDAWRATPCAATLR